MHDAPKLTQADELVLALAGLQAKDQPVRIEALIVAVYKANRGRWGLAGFEGLYPHSNRVVAALSVKSGPVKRGLMERPWPGVPVVRLTEAGRARVAELRQRKAVA